MSAASFKAGRPTTKAERYRDIRAWLELGSTEEKPRCKAITRTGERCPRRAGYPDEHRQSWCLTHYKMLLNMEMA